MKIRSAKLKDIEKMVSFNLEKLFGSEVHSPTNIWLAGLFSKILKNRLLHQIRSGTQFSLLCNAQRILAYISYFVQNQKAIINDICASHHINATELSVLISETVKRISNQKCNQILAWLPREQKDFIALLAGDGFIRSGNKEEIEVEYVKYIYDA